MSTQSPFRTSTSTTALSLVKKQAAATASPVMAAHVTPARRQMSRSTAIVCTHIQSRSSQESCNQQPQQRWRARQW